MIRLRRTIGTHTARLAGGLSLWRRSLGWVALLVLLLPLSAVGQDASVQELIEQGARAEANADRMRTVASRAEAAGLDAGQTAALLRPVVALAEKDLPAAPLLNKTLEGIAKRVPPNRMTPVLQDLQASTERAGGVVSAWLNRNDVEQFVGGVDGSPAARADLITKATEAQQQDVPLETVEQFLDGLPAAVEGQSVSVSQVATAVSVMPDLSGSTGAPQVTQQLLTAALNAGYDDESLRQLPAALEHARRQTQRPAGAVARGVAQAAAQGTPASRVLQRLFQGAMPGGGTPAEVGNGPPGTLPGQDTPSRRNGPPDDKGPGDNPGGGGPGGGGQGGGNPRGGGG